MKNLLRFTGLPVFALIPTMLMASLPWTDNFNNLDNWPNQIGDSGATVSINNDNLRLFVPEGDATTGPRRIVAQTNNNDDFNFFNQPITISLHNIYMEPIPSGGRTEEYYLGLTTNPTSSLITGSETKILIRYRRGTSSPLDVRLTHYKGGTGTTVDYNSPNTPLELGRLDLSLTSNTWLVSWYDTDMQLLDSFNGSWDPDPAEWTNFAVSIGIDQSRERGAIMEVDSITVIPEPRTAALILGGILLTMAMVVRRRLKVKI